jgi:hypothetical protein
MAETAENSISYPAKDLLSNAGKPEPPSFTDSAIAILLDPYISKAINDYYGEPTQYALYDAKVVCITRYPFDFVYTVTVAVPTFHGPHNPPYGLETMTFIIKPGGKVTLDKYEHKDVEP